MAPEFFKCIFNPTFLDCITYRPDTLTASGDKVHFNIGSGDIWTTLSKADKRILHSMVLKLGWSEFMKHPYSSNNAHAQNFLQLASC
jgi:hypothetical protein